MLSGDKFTSSAQHAKVVIVTRALSSLTNQPNRESALL